MAFVGAGFRSGSVHRTRHLSASIPTLHHEPAPFALCPTPEPVFFLTPQSGARGGWCYGGVGHLNATVHAPGKPDVILRHRIRLLVVVVLYQEGTLPYESSVLLNVNLLCDIQDYHLRCSRLSCICPFIVAFILTASLSIKLRYHTSTPPIPLRVYKMAGQGE